MCHEVGETVHFSSLPKSEGGRDADPGLSGYDPLRWSLAQNTSTEKNRTDQESLLLGSRRANLEPVLDLISLLNHSENPGSVIEKYGLWKTTTQLSPNLLDHQEQLLGSDHWKAERK